MPLQRLGGSKERRAGCETSMAGRDEEEEDDEEDQDKDEERRGVPAGRIPRTPLIVHTLFPAAARPISVTGADTAPAGKRGSETPPCTASNWS